MTDNKLRGGAYLIAKILIVEDEKPISNLIILDVMLPEVNGFALMEYLKEIPVIFVTARDSIYDKIKGLNSGAEDYLVKPFEMQELTARINVILRRYGKNVTEFKLKGVTVDFRIWRFPEKSCWIWLGDISLREKAVL